MRRLSMIAALLLLPTRGAVGHLWQALGVHGSVMVCVRACVCADVHAEAGTLPAQPSHVELQQL